MSPFQCLQAVAVLGVAASLTACSALTEPDAITISAEPIARAPAPPAAPARPAVAAAMPGGAPGGAPKTGG